MKINILSPHIDDAAYCLALTISQCVNSHIPVSIINCFTVTKWTIVYVSKDISEISLLRKKEDEEFYKCYNTPIDIINLDLRDAPLRNGYIFQYKPLEPDEWEVVAGDQKLFIKKYSWDFILPIGNWQSCRSYDLQRSGYRALS